MIDVIVHLLHTGVTLCDLELLDLCGFILISMYDFLEFRNWMSLNSRVVQKFKSYSFILSFNSRFNISGINLCILLIITSKKSLLLLISSVFVFSIMSSVTVLIVLLNLVIYLCLGHGCTTFQHVLTF